LRLSAQEEIASFDYFFDGSGRAPRYYQQDRINRTVEAIAQGQNRFCLSWRRAQVKHNTVSVIYLSGKNGEKSAFFFWQTRNVLLIKPSAMILKHF